MARRKSMLGGAARVTALAAAALAAYGLTQRNRARRQAGARDTREARNTQAQQSDKVDRESEQSFPASDPPANY